MTEDCAILHTWQLCGNAALNLAICPADNFIMKSIKNHDAYSSRLSPIGSISVFAAKAGERVGNWMGG